MKININFTTMLTGHDETRANFHRLKVMEQTCPCNNGDQTIDHLLYQCTLYTKTTSKKYGFKDWELTRKETRVNIETFESIYHIYKFDRLEQL